MTTLEDEFTEEMKNLCARIEGETDLKPTKRRTMIASYRGKETAKILLGPKGEDFWGFQELKKIGRLDLTEECLLLRPNFQELFEPELLYTARQRLRDGGYDPKRCEQE